MAAENRKAGAGGEEVMAVTLQELRGLRREVEEAKWLSFTVLQVLAGKKNADKALAKLHDWLDDPWRRFSHGTPVYEITRTYARLIDAELFTLEEIAAKSRAEVVAVEGVGRATMRVLEDAMAERGLSFADED